MRVYKYRGIESDILKRDMDTFQSNQFFAPTFEKLNDPFEANFNEVISKTLDVLNTVFLIEAEKMKRQLQVIMGFKLQLGVLSLSKTCFSEQMWAYYSSSNRGYCIEYELKKLMDKTKNFDFLYKLEVNYCNEIPTLGYEDLKDNLMVHKMFGVKKKSWEHEEEVRLLFDNSCLKSHHESAVTAIYFGYQADDSLIDTFRERFKNRNIGFYKMSVNKQKGCLEAKLMFESKKLYNFSIDKYQFKILNHQDNSTVENYYIYLKEPLSIDALKEFVLAFRENVCYKPSNLNIFDSPDISDLIGVDSLTGTDYVRYANAFVASTDFSNEDFINEYPYKDTFYEQQLKILEKASGS